MPNSKKIEHSVVYRHSEKFPCNICSDKCYTSDRALTLHIKATHNANSVYTGSAGIRCCVCSAIFKSLDAMMKHQRGMNHY